MTDHPSRRPAALLALLAAFALAAPSAAQAQGSVTPEQAAKVENLAMEANKLRKQGRHDEAIEKLKEAVGIYSAPWLLYNLGRTYEEAGDLNLAKAHYELCLGPNVDAAVKKRASDGLTRIRKAVRPGFLVVQVEPVGATVLVDGVVSAQMGGDPIELSPGTHRVRVEAAGREPHEQDVRIEPGATQRIEVRLPARGVAVPAPAPMSSAPAAPVEREEAEPSGGVSPVAWVLLAAGAGLAGGGAYMYTDGSSKWDEVNNAQSVAMQNEQIKNMTEARAKQLIDAGKTRHTIGLVLIGAGAASIVGSIAMFIFSGGDAEEAAARGAAPTLVLSPHPYGGLSVTGGF